MRIWPYLHEYVKTNYFTFILACVVVLAIFLKDTRLKGLLKSYGTKRRWLAFFIMLGVVLRLLWLWTCHYRPAFSWHDIVSQQTWTEYNEINIYAASIKDGIWFRGAEGLAQARRPIGYPVFLGLFYAIFGANFYVLYFLNLSLFVLGAVLFYKVANEMFGERSALWAVFFYSFYPLSIYGVSLPLDEHLFMPLWLGGLYLLFKEMRGQRIPAAWLSYGLLFGYATMTRTHAMFMPLVVGYAYFLLRRSWKKILPAVLTIFLIGQLLTIPWVIRNYRQWRVYLPHTATFYSIYYANNPAVKHANSNGEIPKPGEEGYSAELTQAVAVYDVPNMERLAKQEVKQWILAHPGEFAVLGIERWLHFMGTSRDRGIWAIDLIEQAVKDRPELKLDPGVRHAAEEMAFGAYYLTLYLFLGGVVWVVRSWRLRSPEQRRALCVICVCFLLYLGEQFLIYPERKYRFPLEIFMLMVVGAFFSSLLYDLRIGGFFRWQRPRDGRIISS